jgi:long-chain acyl-CoA synthetase
VNVAYWLERAGLAEPNQPAIAVGGKVTSTYSELARDAASLGSALLNVFKLKRGDRVAIASRNHRTYLEILFGIWWAGLVAVPINAKLHAKEVGWILEDTGAAVAFVSNDLSGSIGSLDVPNLRSLINVDSREIGQLKSVDSIPITSMGSDELAWIFYTSGTTGKPKGAMLTHQNLTVMSLAFLAGVQATTSEDVMLHVAPMSHGSGLYGIPQIGCKGLNVIPESGGFDSSEVFELAKHWKNISLFAAPTMIRRLAETTSDWGSTGLRTIFWGGAPMLVSDVEWALDRIGPRLAQVYGQGETPMTISSLSKDVISNRTHHLWRQRVGSVGLVNPAVEVRIGDSNSATLATGEIGEILVRGETVMAGYWNNDDASNRTLRGGWLHTGDIGFFDQEGFLTLKDRSHDLIISGGSNIYPREIEELLISHYEVKEVAVIGKPDPEWGEIVVAYIVGDVEASELDQLCLTNIARFKRPKHYVKVKELPKNNYGKILKSELKKIENERSDNESK